MQAKVWADSTPENPLRGEGPYIGYIECEKPEAVPILQMVGNQAMTFAGWWQVEIIQGIAWGDYTGDPANY
jgi:hypothetical protein